MEAPAASAPTPNQREQVSEVLQALKQASHHLQANPTSSQADTNAFLHLQTQLDAILSSHPTLSTLSRHLSDLKTLIHDLPSTRRRYGIRSFLTRRLSAYAISRLAASIQSEIQAWIDRESIVELLKILGNPNRSRGDDDELSRSLLNFEARVSQGFNRELQDLVLRFRVFPSLEQALCDSKGYTTKVREEAAFAIASLIRFNKDVFVGEVLMGPTVRALVSMGSVSSFRVLCLLIRSIKSPLVDEIESNQEIPKIINCLCSQNLQLRVAAMECVLEIGYFGRKEAVEAMLQEGLIKKLMGLQRSEVGGDLSEENREEDSAGGVGGGGEERVLLEMRPFASCVARFSVQLEIGEGLRQREKRAFKQEILRRVREASVTDAEAATVVVEVLWGSWP